MKLKLTINRDYLGNGVNITFEFIFIEKDEGFFTFCLDRTLDANNVSIFLSYIRDLDEGLFDQICGDLIEWACMASMIKGVSSDFAKYVCDYINKCVVYNPDHGVDEATFILDSFSPSLVSSLSASGLVNPARAFALLPNDCRSKASEAEWYQRLVEEYDEDGTPIKWREKVMVYYGYRINVPTIPGVTFPAIRCICPSTGATHWLLVPDRLVTDPRAAIAWTCQIPTKLLEYGRYWIKRQGDVFLFELWDDLSDDEIKDLMESPLTHHPVESFWSKYIDEA